MEIKDFKSLVVERSMKFIQDEMGGTVVRTADDIGKTEYGIYIPRMCMGIPTNKGPFENTVQLDTGLCLNVTNNKFGEDSIISSNYVLLTMMNVYNLSMPKLALGEQVTVGLIDQDIKSMYIKPYQRNQVQYRPYDIMQLYAPASGKYDGADLDDTNSYYMRVDSENKFVRIHMSNANGETSSYDITFDGNNGYLTMTDGERKVIINTNNDEVTMSNKNSNFALRGDTIEADCKKFYVTADDEVEIDTKKFTLKADNQVQMTSKKSEFDFDNFKISGKKIEEDYDKCDITNKKRTVTSDLFTIDSLTEVSKWLNANGGIGFGAPPGQQPLPTLPQISGKGMANFMGSSGIPLVKGQQLAILLTAIAAQADAAGSAGPAIIPPTASATVAAMISQIISPVAKG